MRRLTAMVASVAVLVAVAWWLLRPDVNSRGSAAAAVATKTVAVTRQDLVARQTVDGTIGYAGDWSVVNNLSGTLTALPDKGAVVEAGRALYRVDQRPATLLYGDVPAWREMGRGMADGPDVRQLESNLVTLGLATERQLTVDERFTPATSAAVRRWQKSLGLDQTGTVGLGDVVFLPGPARVAEVEATRGTRAAPGGSILEATSTSRVVEVELDATKQSLVNVGDKVGVTLPSGATTGGTVATVGSVAESRGEGESAREVIDVTVTLDDPAGTGTLDQAPVEVGIVADSRQGVLSVPVSALLALREGGYGVRVVERSGTRVVAVETGLFAAGMVEVSGDDLREGLHVEVPAS